jgi:hypothetical protein
MARAQRAISILPQRKLQQVLEGLADAAQFEEHRHEFIG